VNEITEQAIALKKEKIIRGITCPACSGELDIRDGMRTFNCKYCGTMLRAKGTEGALKYYVPRKIKRDDAINRTFKWLEKGVSKAKALSKLSKIDEAFPVYIPYWRVRADVVGWVFGVEKKTTTTSSGTRTEYVDKEIKIQNSFDVTLPACDIAELGVKKVNLQGDEIKPVDFETLQSDGMLFNVISSEKEITDNSLNNFKIQAQGAINLHEVTFEHYDLVRQNTSLIYYPLWIVRYIFNNRTYQVVVDGEDGAICYGKAPGSNLFRAIVGIFGLGAGMFFASLFEIILIDPSSKGPWIGYLISLVVGILLISWAYKKFRYGGEIEEGTGLVADSKIPDLIQKTGITKTNFNQKSITDFATGAVSSAVVGSILGSILSNKK
jgi:hypothetical protein